ncbi:MAG: polymer-forming cytoskeletal protein [Pseudomonadota bacterium]
MFSKPKPPEPNPPSASKPSTPSTATTPAKPVTDTPSSAPKPKPAPSVLSSDLTIEGHLKTTGDIQVEGNVIGDIRAHLLTIGEKAVVKGEVVADDVVVTGRVEGRVRGLKVRLTSTANVQGDIVHKTIAIESGAHFEGSVQRQDDPLTTKSAPSAAKKTAAE